MDIHPARLAVFPIFKGVGISELLALVAAGHGETQHRGDVLFREGSRAKDAFLVVQGRLGVYLGEGVGERLIGEVRGGEVVGEAGLMNLTAKRNATVRALVDTDLLRITPRTLLDQGGNPAMVAIEMHVLAAMARRIRSANLRLEEALAPPDSAPRATLPPPGAGGRTLPPPSRGQSLSGTPPAPSRSTVPPPIGARPTLPPPRGDADGSEPRRVETLTQTLLRILGGK